MALTDLILNDPSSGDPKRWLHHMDQALASDPEKETKIAQAIRAYFEEMAPKSLQDLLQVSKANPAEAQVWISVLPDTDKDRFASEIEAAINTLNPPAPTPNPPVPNPPVPNSININDVITQISKLFDRVDPTYPDNHNGIEQKVARLISSLKNHPDLEKKRGGIPNVDRLDDLIQTTKNKFTDEKRRQRLHALVDEIQDDSVTESWVPVVNIKNQLRKMI